MNCIDRSTHTHQSGNAQRFAISALAMAVAMAWGANALAAPVGGVVKSGTAAISTGAGTTVINQSTQNVVINWQSFNIGTNEAVRFIQPGSDSVALNRVLGSDPSSILGRLSANGKVFLVNPNGVLFGKGASVNVGALVASTLDIGDQDFMDGKYRFSGAGSGAVRNEGALSSADGGFVALLGADVGNHGVITARLGQVALAAGEAITLDVAGDGLLNVTVNRGALNALVQNGGLIQADGGQVLLSAQAAGDLMKNSVNNTGVIRAHTLENRNGTIRLLGGTQGGTVQAGGLLDASAPHAGDGGFVETSAAHVSIDDAVRVTTAAPRGRAGTWLIDPVDFVIAAAGGDISGTTLGAQLAGGNVTILSTAGRGDPAAGKGDVIVADTVNWSANRLTLNAQNNIQINSPMNGTGSASLALEYGQRAVATGNTSTYNVLAPVNLPSGQNFSTKLGSNGVLVNYTVLTTLGVAGSTSGTDLQGMNGNLAGHYALGSNIDAAPTSAWNAGAGFDPIGKIAAPDNFTGNFDGLGHTISGLAIARPLTNNVGLFGYAVSANGAALKNVTLAGGSVAGGSYVGTLAGHVTGDIVNSHSTQLVTASGAPDSYAGGLAGWSTGNISNSSSTGAVTATGSYVGGLVGWITGDITCCFATGPVTGSGSYVGGLAGWVTGDVSRAYATGNVNTAALYVGGLLGWVTGDVSNSYATGNVSTSGGNVGGLVGWKTGAISNSYSAGTVAGAVPIGGLIGFDNGGVTTNSFWDITTSGQGLSAGGAGVKGMTSLEMRQQLNYTSATSANTPLSPSWDFASIWTMMQNGVSYPSLQACLAPAVWALVPQPVVPPVVVPPVIVPPVIVPPIVVPPVVVPPVVTPPVVVPPVVPPVVTPPVVVPPVVVPPPVVAPPVVVVPPEVTPPEVTPPVPVAAVAPPFVAPPSRPPVSPASYVPPVVAPPFAPPVLPHFPRPAPPLPPVPPVVPEESPPAPYVPPVFVPKQDRN